MQTPEAILAQIHDWLRSWPELEHLLRLAGEQPVHLVGGSVRDLWLGRSPKDADVVLERDVERLARQLARQVGGALVPLHEAPPTYRIVLRDYRTFDLAGYRSADLVGDLRARDFTANAMALDLRRLLLGGQVELVDPLGGQADLAAGRLAVTSAQTFQDDPLRLLRAYRFQARFGWRPTPETSRLRREQAGLLRRSARERVAVELVAILLSRRAGSVLRAMAADGLLEPALGQLERGWRRLGRRPGGWRGFERLTRLGLALGRSLDPTTRQAVAGWLEHELSHERSRAVLMSWLTLTLAGGRRWRRRPRRVAALAQAVAAGRSEERLALAITADPHLGQLLAGALSGEVLHGWLADLGEAAPGALILSWLARSPAAATTARLGEGLSLYWRVVEPLLLQPPLLDGATLMQACELAPGPRLGQALAVVRSAQRRGLVTTPTQALALVRAWLAEQAASRPVS